MNTRIVKITRKHIEVIETTVEIPETISLSLEEFAKFIQFDGLYGVTEIAEVLLDQLHPAHHDYCDDEISIVEVNEPGERHYALTDDLLDAMSEEGILLEDPDGE